MRQELVGTVREVHAISGSNPGPNSSTVRRIF